MMILNQGFEWFIFILFKGGIFMKKFIAVLLSSAMMFGGVRGVFADEVIPTALEQTILTVKDKIGIPKEYSEFKYEINTFDGSEKERYTLIWEKKEFDEEKGRDSISAGVDAEGNIYFYENYGIIADKRDGSLKNQKSKSECLKAAEDFLKKILPENYSEFELCDSNGNNHFVFRQNKNDVPVRFNLAEVTVDSETLGIVSYNFNKADYADGNFEDKASVISEKDASDIFFENVKFEPEYFFNYDYRTKEKSVFLAYNPERLYGNSIDAKTGDLIKCDVYNYMFARTEDSMNDKESGASKGEEINLSEQEISEVEQSKDLLSKEEADSEIRKVLPESVRFKELQSAFLSKENIDDKYTWIIDYENGYASIDAKTKKLKNFYLYNNNNGDFPTDGKKEEVSEERKAKALEYINKIAPEKVESIEFSEESSAYDLNFKRKVNGFDFNDNYINVTFDKDGNIISYSSYWYDSVKFPKAENIIDGKKIYEEIKDKAGFDLIYEYCEQNNKNNIVLSYSFINGDNTAPLIDAVTGKELGYDGKEYKREFKLPESYPDVKGHWCEKYVNMLLNNGIYVKREMFLPDEKITKAELLEFYNNFGEETRKAFKDNKDFISRKEICKVISKTLGYGKLAEKKDAFNNPFVDVSDTDDGFGFMAAANALGIITADGGGNFYPDREITNAEAAKIICDLEELIED